MSKQEPLVTSETVLTGQDSYLKGHLFNLGLINSDACESLHESNEAD